MASSPPAQGRPDSPDTRRLKAKWADHVKSQRASGANAGDGVGGHTHEGLRRRRHGTPEATSDGRTIDEILSAPAEVPNSHLPTIWAHAAGANPNPETPNAEIPNAGNTRRSASAHGDAGQHSDAQLPPLHLSQTQVNVHLNVPNHDTTAGGSRVTEVDESSSDSEPADDIDRPARGGRDGRVKRFCRATVAAVSRSCQWVGQVVWAEIGGGVKKFIAWMVICLVIAAISYFVLLPAIRHSVSDLAGSVPLLSKLASFATWFYEVILPILGFQSTPAAAEAAPVVVAQQRYRVVTTAAVGITIVSALANQYAHEISQTVVGSYFWSTVAAWVPSGGTKVAAAGAAVGEGAGKVVAAGAVVGNEISKVANRRSRRLLNRRA